jgi:pimeloyl-ACP methyl ester carboxylesterase
VIEPVWRDEVIAGEGVQLAARDYGGVGRSIVLVHGGPGQNLATWDHFIPHIANDFRIVALDLRGNGASSDADDYSYPAIASDVQSVVEHYRLEQPIVVGHSWGGQVAVFYASLYHECAGVIGVDGWITDVGEVLASDAWDWLERDYAADPYLNFVGTQDQLEAELADIRERYGEGAADVARRQFVQRPDGIFRMRRTVAEFIAMEKAVSREGHALTSEVYERIQCPCLLIGAERSEFERRDADTEARFGPWGFSRSATKPIVERFPNVRAVWWPCGHGIPTEMPEELAQALRDFPPRI